MTLDDLFLVPLDFSDYELQKYSELHDLTESMLVDSLSSFRLWVDKQAAKIKDEEALDSHYDFHSERFTDLSETFPEMVRNSMIVSLSSFLEKSLSDYCKTAQQKHNLALSMGDLNGKPLDRAKVYFKKVLKLPFPDTGALWFEIDAMQRIRQIIVHDNGETTVEKIDKLPKTLNNSKYLLVKHGQLLVQKDLIGYYIELIRKLLGQLRVTIKQS